MALLAVVFVFAAASIVGSWALVEGLVTFDEVERLRAETARLRLDNEVLESRLWDLQSQLADSEARTHELAQVAGVELDGLTLGLGGEPPVRLPTEERLERLSSRSRRLASALDDVELKLVTTPSMAPAEGRLTSRYGYRLDPLTGERSFHRGIDIGSDPGGTVRAAASGVVTLAGRKGALGNAVHLRHRQGLSTRYGHLSKLAVSSGQRVERGEIVGFVGRTGRATGYHLHFEILENDRPVDPLAYIGQDLGRR